MKDDFINQFEKPNLLPPEFASRLYQRITQPMYTHTKISLFRSFALALTVFALMCAAVLFSPPARALAEGFLRHIGVYTFQQGIPVVNSLKSPEPVGLNRTPNSVSINAAKDVPTASDGPGASRLAGFQVLRPAYLPAGFTDMGAWYAVTDESGITVIHAYRGGTNHFLVVNQLKHALNQAQQTYAEEQIVDVTVRGQAGVWIPGTVRDGGRKEALVWDENGITYSLISDSLPLDEMMKVAESLGK